MPASMTGCAPTRPSSWRCSARQLPTEDPLCRRKPGGCDETDLRSEPRKPRPAELAPSSDLFPPLQQAEAHPARRDGQPVGSQPNSWAAETASLDDMPTMASP